SLIEQIRTLLAERGALFFDEITSSLEGFPNDLLAALWRLVWRGEVTNDTLAPLRSLIGSGDSNSNGSRGGRRGRHGFRSRRRGRLPGSEGRWALLRSRNAAIPNPTQRVAALAQQLVERHGILTRDQLAREQIEGGFSAVYPVLKAMEESGRVRRGYFVEGQGGAQFAAAGADQLLREPAPSGPIRPLVLAATDPASAYGTSVPW